MHRYVTTRRRQYQSLATCYASLTVQYMLDRFAYLMYTRMTACIHCSLLLSCTLALSLSLSLCLGVKTVTGITDAMSTMIALINRSIAPAGKPIRVQKPSLSGSCWAHYTCCASVMTTFETQTIMDEYVQLMFNRFVDAKDATEHTAT